jgi:hypothetical protein
LAEDRALLIRCIDATEAARADVDRADLARVTALLAARYENVLADCVYAQIVGSLGTASDLKGAEVRVSRLRHAIGAVRAVVKGVAPIDGHVDEPDHLEMNIDAMTTSLRRFLEYEDDALFKLVDLLNAEDADRLRQCVEGAAAHRTSLPGPPGNSVLRRLAEIKEVLRVALHEVAPRPQGFARGCEVSG